MTILHGSKRKVTSYSEFVEAFDVSPQEILDAKGAEYRADVLESAQERSDDAGPNAIEYIPDEFLQDLLAQDTLEDIIGPVLTARDQDYVYLREYGVHTIISIKKPRPGTPPHRGRG